MTRHCYMGLVAVVSVHICGRPEFFQLRDACSTLKRMPKAEGEGGDDTAHWGRFLEVSSS